MKRQAGTALGIFDVARNLAARDRLIAGVTLVSTPVGSGFDVLR